METDINLYNAFNETAAILNFKMAAVIGKFHVALTLKNSYNYKSTTVPSFMLLSKSAQSTKKLLHIRPATHSEKKLDLQTRDSSYITEINCVRANFLCQQPTDVRFFYRRILMDPVVRSTIHF